MRNNQRPLKARFPGLTLIEIMVGLAVIGVLLAVAAPSMADLLERRRVIAAAEEVSGILTYAKAETNATNSFLIVRFDPDTYNAASNKMSCALVTTGTGTANRCKCYYAPTDLCPGTGTKPLRLFQLPKTHVEFTAYAADWKGPANYIRFMRDQNTIAAEGFEVDVNSLRKGYTLRVQVNAAGRVKICAPSAGRAANAPFAQMNGYGACT